MLNNNMLMINRIIIEINRIIIEILHNVIGYNVWYMQYFTNIAAIFYFTDIEILLQYCNSFMKDCNLSK